MNIEKKFLIINIKKLISEIYPILSPNRVKYDNGVVGVIGGSIDYTGAPFYSAIAALKSGSDLSHIFCHSESAIAIKCYSPEIIVHSGFDDDENNSQLLNKTIRWFKSMNSIVLGPGLGRSLSMNKIFTSFLESTLKLGIFHVIDADGLHYFHKNKENGVIQQIINNQCDERNKYILTPNHKEFSVLFESFLNRKSQINKNTDLIENLLKTDFFHDLESEIIEIQLDDKNYYCFEDEIMLSKMLGNKVIVKKGRFDIITNGERLLIVSNKGSSKRSGGMGDILNGIISTLINFTRNNENLDILHAIAASCWICRNASYRAYNKYMFSLTAPDVIACIHESISFLELNYKF